MTPLLIFFGLIISSGWSSVHSAPASYSAEEFHSVFVFVSDYAPVSATDGSRAAAACILQKTLQNETRQLIENKALESLGKRYDSDEFRFSLTFRWIPGHLLRTEPDDIDSVDLVGGVERYTTFEVTLTEGNRKRQVQVQFSVEMEQKLPVAGRRILGGETIEPGNLDVRWVSVSDVRGRMIRQLEELEGKTIRRALAPGEPVRSMDIGSDYLIESGDSVTLIFKNQGVRIELTGEARQSGAESEEIRIYSHETRKRYLGRIVGPGVALWQQTR